MPLYSSERIPLGGQSVQSDLSGQSNLSGQSDQSGEKIKIYTWIAAYHGKIMPSLVLAGD